MTLQEFYNLVDRLEPDERGCKIWPRGCFTRGYAAVDIKELGRVKKKASRIILARRLGRTIRQGYCALHTCDVRRCVNEDHIYEGTYQDNANDAIARNRTCRGDRHHATHPPQPFGDNHWTRLTPDKMCKGSEHHSAKLTEENVRDIRRLYKEGVRQAELKRMFQVSQERIYSIINNKSWKHVT